MQKWRIQLRWRARVSEYVDLQSELKRKKGGKFQKECYSPEQFCKREGVDPHAFRWWLDYIKAEDRYTFYRSFASEHLERAKRALELLDHYINLDPKLRMPLMRDAIISYAALFCKSNGRVFTKWNLEAQTFVPQYLQDVHKKICTDRDVIIAHCDLGPRDPKVSLIGIALRGKGFYWEDYNVLMPQFKELIEAVLIKLKSYSAQENLSTSEEAFQDFPEPPPAALIDPRGSSVDRR